MKYRMDYQETHDIDWFFRYQGKIYHAASNGGWLPDKIDSEKNRIIQESLEGKDGPFSVRFLENRDKYYEKYEDLSSFSKYASLGFISLDRTIEEDANGEGVKFYDNQHMTLRYHVVACPSNGESFNDTNLLALMPALEEADIKID